MPSLSKMNHELEIAVIACMDDLEIHEFYTWDIEQLSHNSYIVTFQDRQNENNRNCVGVSWNGPDALLSVTVLEHPGLSDSWADVMAEDLAIYLNPDHFDSDSDDSYSSDDASITSQPLTPPPSRDRRA